MSSYKFEPGEVIGEQLRRLVRRQLRSAVRALSEDKLSAQGIHRARRCLKRSRSIVILLQKQGTLGRWNAEANDLRSIAHRLAGARDVQAKLDALAKLEAFGRDQSLAATFARLRRSIEARRKSQEQAIEGRAVTKIASALVILAQQFTRKSLRRYDSSDIIAGVVRTYRSGRKLMAWAYKKDRDEDFHEWRKHLQRHWRHMQLLEAAWPDEFSARIKAASELSQLLGDDHDLWMLLNDIGHAKVPLAASKRREIVELARQMQTDLRRRAHVIGLRLFAEKPKRLARRIATYWAVAGEAASQQEPPRTEVAVADPVLPAMPVSATSDEAIVT